MFDLISDLSAGYRTNAVLTAGLHLAASALVLSSTHWSKRSSKRRCGATGLLRQSLRSGTSTMGGGTDLNRPFGGGFSSGCYPPKSDGVRFGLRPFRYSQNLKHLPILPQSTLHTLTPQKDDAVIEAK